MLVPRVIKKILERSQTLPALDIPRAAFTWTSVVISAILTSCIVLICFPFVYAYDRERHFLHTCASFWGKSIQLLNPWWSFIFYGRENLAKNNEAVVYVANHQSQADILAIFMISTRFRWLSKASLFRIPIFGWAMFAVGYVPVVRGNKKSTERCMKQAAKHLKRGTPMIFFPEGTRSKDGELGVFKNGAFRLAVSLGVPIVPITIDGCAYLLPKGSIIPKKATVNVHIHKPISSKNITSNELMAKARSEIFDQLEKNKQISKGIS
jgi:1-acyl-sn-glycerol-3-phosphate acyltransferase